MENMKQMTLKHWGNTSDLLFSQNVNGLSAREELDKVLKQNPNMREMRFCESGFYSKRNKNKKKIIVYAWYWRGNWSDPTKEVYSKLIEV